MNSVALDLGFVQIYWYSIAIICGMAIGMYIVYKEAKKKNINMDFFNNLLFYTIIWGIIGARLYYVVFEWQYYSTHLLEIFEIWNGGLAIHGAILFGAIFLIYYTKKYKVSTFKIMDICVPGLIIGQVIGRWGNFFNGEAFGPIIDIQFLEKLHLPQFVIDGMNIDGNYRHPTFLYESLWNLIGFIIIQIFKRFKYLKKGQLTGFYLMWYSLGRFGIEALRTDSLMLGNLKIAQLVSVGLFVFGFILIIIKGRGSKFENLYNEEFKNDIKF